MENNAEHIADRKGQTITFYSYKGGVGRSMALVNIACLAAKENKKILLIDCDLEAPGLHQFFKTNADTPGFVDLMLDVKEWISNEENNTEDGYYRFMAAVEKYISKDVNPIAGNAAYSGKLSETVSSPNMEYDQSVSIDLIKAGRFNSEYSKKMGAINWLDIYKKAPAFFRTFAYCLEKDYDYIFVDARTGLADTSGICTMLMPQKLILVFALNNQNINGVVDVARQAIEYRFSSNDRRSLQVYPLPSRIENSANPHLQQWIDNYKGKFVTLFTEKYMLDECLLSAYFDRSFIQYYAIHAYGENIPALYESATSSNFITYNYYNFLTVLKKNIPAWEVISLEEELANERLANESFKKGLDFYYKKEYENAIAEYDKAIGLKIDFADAYFNRALCKMGTKKYEEAIAGFNKVLELEPNAADAYYNRGMAKESQQNNEEAIKDYSKAITIKPEYAEAYNGRGNVKRVLKQFESALADYDKAIALKPDYADAYNNRANIFQDLEKNDDAIKDYSTAISLKPDYPLAYHNRGIAKHALKQYEEAIKDYDKTIVLNEKDPSSYQSRGLAKEALKQYEEAIKDYSKAITLDPGDAIGYLNRGIAYEALQQYDLALKDYDKSIELKDDDAIAYYNRGMLYEKQKKNDAAIANYNKSIAIDPGDINVYIERGNIQQALKRYEAAIADYNKAIEIKPGDGLAYFNRGIANEALNKFEEAIADYTTAITLQPDDAMAYYNRGNANEALDKTDEAVADYTKAIELDPNYENAFVNRGTLYFDLKRFENAKTDFEKIIQVNPQNATAYIGRGASLYHLKQYNESIADSLKATELSAELNTPYINLAYAFRQLNNLKSANEYLEKAITMNPEDPFCWVAKAEISHAEGNEDGFYENIDKAMGLTFNIMDEIQNEPEVFDKYLNEPRFLELLKKYNVEPDAKPTTNIYIK